VFELAHDADQTRRGVFDLAAITAGAVRSFALPDVSTELAGLSGAQTFDGDKTFAGEREASGPVATIGTGVGTATYGLGTGATASGATKTVNLGTGGAAGSDTVVNIGSDTSGADGVTVINTPTVTFANTVAAVGMPQANLTALLLGLGGAVADAWNWFSVNTPAVLLNNAGAGIEATVNTAAAGNDASFAFKTGFSARALIGLLCPRKRPLRLIPGAADSKRQDVVQLGFAQRIEDLAVCPSSEFLGCVI
jgi:isopentenyl diphosphate isomerase/L-lactate dehydrogenase-like FMN-dependent dehydrogenase